MPLKDEIAKVPIGRDTGGILMKHLFTVNEDLRVCWDCEEIDPDSVPRSQRLVMEGAHIQSVLYGLVQDSAGNEHNYRSGARNFAQELKEKGFKLDQVKHIQQALFGLLAAKGAPQDKNKAEWDKWFANLIAEMKEGGLS